MSNMIWRYSFFFKAFILLRIAIAAVSSQCMNCRHLVCKLARLPSRKLAKDPYITQFPTIQSSIRRGSRILKWGVNFCNNVIEPKPGCLRDKKKKKEGRLRKRGVKIHPFHLPWIRASGCLYTFTFIYI